MNKNWILIFAIGFLVAAGSLYWYRQATPALNTMQEAEAPTLTQSDSFEDIQQDLETTEITIEDTEYSSVTTDINGL